MRRSDIDKALGTAMHFEKLANLVLQGKAPSVRLVNDDNIWSTGAHSP